MSELTGPAFIPSHRPGPRDNLTFPSVTKDEAAAALKLMKPAKKKKMKGEITELRPGQIIVVGTNKRGMHAAGAAFYAHQHFGLRWGVGEGLSGMTYALPTMSGLEDFEIAVARFLVYAELSNDLTFLLTKVGCGIAGYDDAAVSHMFEKVPDNVVLPHGWPL